MNIFGRKTLRSGIEGAGPGKGYRVGNSCGEKFREDDLGGGGGERRYRF